jgi:hypothetical protein
MKQRILKTYHPCKITSERLQMGNDMSSKEGRLTASVIAISRVVLGIAFAALTLAPAQAEMTNEELAKLSQNPVGNLISVPFQNNSNLNYGPLKKTQNILNIEPVIPIELDSDWNIITRTIIPVVSQPPLFAGDDRLNGVAPAQISAFLSPATPKGGIIWGAGAIAQIPTASNSALGSNRWGLGPTFVVLHLDKGDPWMYGVLANNVWSVGGGSGGSYTNFLAQPFISYNFKGGTYLNSSPIITANWKADSGNQWTVPLGAGIGHIFHLGKLPVNVLAGAYYNVVKPDFGSNVNIQVQVKLMFPK